MSNYGDNQLRGLDDYITGINDPNAPFNRPDPDFWVEKIDGQWLVVSEDSEGGPYATEAEAIKACDDAQDEVDFRREEREVEMYEDRAERLAEERAEAREAMGEEWD